MLKNTQDTNVTAGMNDIVQNSSSELCHKVHTSYGVSTEFLLYLDPLEQLRLQHLCLYWYQRAVSRVQTRL